jgi:hypothetical protein
LGGALVAAMNAIEADFAPLQGSLPKDYDRFDNKLLENLLRCFDSQALRQATGDVFGRIYEYFLMKFAMQGAQDNGEFFTPPSLVQTLVNIIEPDHGVVADLACGSGGMFAPSLLLGALTGGAFGLGLHAAGFASAPDPSQCALVGMAAMVAATAHAPLTGVLLVYELTHIPSVILPLMLTAVIATTMSRLLHRESIYTASLSVLGIRLRLQGTSLP